MELIVKENTVRLIEAFQARHMSPLWDSGKSKVDALNGALMSITSYLSDERAGETLLAGQGGRYTSFTMKELFEQAAVRQPGSGAKSVKLINLPAVADLAPVHAFLKANKILGDDSTPGNALDLAMQVAHDLEDKGPLSTRTKDGAVRARLVLI